MANASGHGPRSPARDRTITWVKQLGRRRWKPRAMRSHLTTNLFANIIAGNKGVGKGNGSLKKAGSNWVDGDRFFDREAELDVLTDRVRNGTIRF